MFFQRSDEIIEETIDGEVKIKNDSKKQIKQQDKDLIKDVVQNKYQNEPITISEKYTQ